MKTSVKFMLALGSGKLIMTNDGNAYSFYTEVDSHSAPKTAGSLKRIMSCLSAAK